MKTSWVCMLLNGGCTDSGVEQALVHLPLFCLPAFNLTMQAGSSKGRSYSGCDGDLIGSETLLVH